MNNYKKILVALLVTISLISCSKDDSAGGNNSPNGVFIGVNDDNRTLALNDIGDTYRIDLSSLAFNENSYEPAGIQFVMEIWDKNKAYIGGIGGNNSCQVIELYVDVFKNDFKTKTTIKTYASPMTKAGRKDKCNIFIRLKDINRKLIIMGEAINGQDITVENKNGVYTVEFSKLKIVTENGTSSFTCSGRIITN